MGVETGVRRATGAIVGQRLDRTLDLQPESLGLRWGSDALPAVLPSKVQSLMTYCSLDGCVGGMRYDKVPTTMLMILDYAEVRGAVNMRLSMYCVPKLVVSLWKALRRRFILLGVE